MILYEYSYLSRGKVDVSSCIDQYVYYICVALLAGCMQCTDTFLQA